MNPAFNLDEQEIIQYRNEISIHERAAAYFEANGLEHAARHARRIAAEYRAQLDDAEQKQ